jgi:hypothetical protein
VKQISARAPLLARAHTPNLTSSPSNLRHLSLRRIIYSPCTLRSHFVSEIQYEVKIVMLLS